ncbi:MAG: carboxypeptidase regulatory-like domain-containing protein [Myxococcota bacterium]
MSRTRDWSGSALLCGAVLLAPIDALAAEVEDDAPALRRDYEGPETSPKPDAAEVEVVAPAPSEAPPAELSEEAPPPDVAPPEPEPEPPAVAEVEEDAEEGDFEFDFVDLTEDEEALAEELKVETKKVRGKAGTVTGRVLDSTTGEPLIGAYVEAIGTEYKTKTDANGEYTLELPVGTWEMRIRSDANQPRRVSNVVIEEGDTQTINSELKPLEGAGQTVLVQAEMNRESEGARLLQRKESAAARDLMSRDEISKSGGGSTSAVARRIVGVTVVGGRYLFVRGLGHRYVNTLFDGARVPSPEPELRTVPLDIFPSSALSAINVQKTFTPDVPGDFAGGSIQLESREVPDDLIVSAGANVGFNSATTFRQMLTNGSFPAEDAFGFGNIPRGLPGNLPTNTPASRGVLDDDFQPVYTPEEIEAFGDAMYTDTRMRTGTAPPNFGVNATAGYGFEPHGEDSKLGFLVSAKYKNQHQTHRFEDPIRQFSLSDGENLAETPQVNYNGRRTRFTVGWSTVGLVKYDPNKNHRIEALGFYSREAEDETRQLDGIARNVSGPDPVISTRIRYIMRSIAMTRLGGKHEFPKAKGLTVDWFGSYAQARRDDPAIRENFFTDADGDGEYIFDRGNEGGKQTFLDLTDHTESGAANVTMPFKQWNQLKGKVKAGAWVEGKQRQFDVRRFLFQGGVTELIPPGTGNIINNSTIGGAPDENAFFLQEATRATDNYRASQEIYAGYAMTELPLVRWFKIAGGARLEQSTIRVQPFDPYAEPDDEPDELLEEVEVSNLDVLPSVSLIFSPTDKQNIRIVGSRTLARPEFRELAPFAFTDFVGGTEVVGNPALAQTKIWNADLRWEWFPSSSEVIAASLFYKFLDEPIEQVQLPRIPFLASYRNADAAQNFGLELEARKNLEFIWKSLDDFSIGANFTLLRSRVQLRPRCEPSPDNECDVLSASDVSTSRERPLQDQSPFVVNAYLDYENDNSGTGARVLYNIEGEKITYVGGLGLPDVYLEPRHKVDVTFSQRLYKGLVLDLSAQNLANASWEWTQADRVLESWKEGLTFTIGLSYSFDRGDRDEEE